MNMYINVCVYIMCFSMGVYLYFVCVSEFIRIELDKQWVDKSKFQYLLEGPFLWICVYICMCVGTCVYVYLLNLLRVELDK